MGLPNSSSLKLALLAVANVFKDAVPFDKKELFMHKLNIESISQAIIGDGRDPQKTIEITFAEQTI